ncbi:SDR family NAD(P)-dependent oxidoreductase [Gordonia sp. ABSL11-1]|uniref:SDR family NAD(P)-dependent oxidoreductase n=1 Tax=Gordonia sp. ABSL11-1 TaxID=3053924 RepID=UPI0025747BC3|nr:SDR family NAD(P)-dependent oxidoreductase [Gordonia sp. ABSL11-1]MDL9948612.1 SDR family NAD(P)-dependent oxidoreductase [Gordonia sp. ABSL11-1]
MSEISATTKIAVVTGANKGVGFAIAQGLADAGATVFVGSRDRHRGEEAVDALISARPAGAIDVRLLEIDVTDDESVVAAAKQVAQSVPRVDVLVNNAGLAHGFTTLPSVETLDGIKQIYEVNVFGAIRVTQAFLPLVRTAPAGSIVMVSSMTGSLTAALDPEGQFYRVNSLGYNSSKSALNAAVIAFAKELSDSNIRVNAVEPGFVSTDMNANRGVLSPADGAAPAIRVALDDSDDRPTASFFGADGPHPW